MRCDDGSRVIEPLRWACRLRHETAAGAGICRAGGTLMRRWISRFLAAVGIVAAFAVSAAPAYAEKRVALVVGNNDYRNVPKLQKAVNDARTMGDTLKQLGFTVMVAENQNRQAFSQTLLAFDNAVEAGHTAFFFYARHGFEIAGQNFLLPTDVPAAPGAGGRVRELGELVGHKQIPFYFDQMVDDVFLNGRASKAQPEVAVKPAEPLQKRGALPPVHQLKPQNDSVNAPIAMFSRHNGGWTGGFSIAHPTPGLSWRVGGAGDFPG